MSDCASTPNARAVPPVLSAVIHHGSHGWAAPQELSELYDAAPAFIAAAGPHLPALRLVLDDLSAIPDEVLRARAASGMVRLALLLLKHGRDGVDVEGRHQRWISLAAEVAGAASGLERSRS